MNEQIGSEAKGYDFVESFRVSCAVKKALYERLQKRKASDPIGTERLHQPLSLQEQCL